MLNAVILLAAVGAIVIESIRKFREPAEVSEAYLRMAADTLVSACGKKDKAQHT